MKAVLFLKYRWVACLVVSTGCLVCCFSSVIGQPLQREWARTYSMDQAKFNEPTAIALSPDGNVIVAGTSQNSGGDFDYELIKYSPNGDEIWKVRYGTPNQGNDQLNAMTLDPNGNIIVTGTSDTVKFAQNGSLVWTAPVGGRAVVANSTYVYITGIAGTDIITVQLANNDTDGHEVWMRSLDGHDHGTDVGQVITLDGGGNVYVAGQEEYEPCTAVCYKVYAVVSYAPDGTKRWFADLGQNVFGLAQAQSIIVQTNSLVYLYGTYETQNAVLAEFSPTESVRFWDSRSPGAASFGAKMIRERATGNLLTTGSDNSQRAFINRFLLTDASFTNVWFYAGPVALAGGMGLVEDSRGNIYVAGFSYNDSSSSAMLVAKVTPTGQQLGLDRFNSPDAGSNFGTAIIVDANDNIYVTGYVLNTQGGSEFVTIKYSATPTIEQKSGGAMHLEFQTNPGQPYAIQATTDFFNWQSLITNTADANGLIQFDDTNAPTIPYRFFRGHPNP